MFYILNLCEIIYWLIRVVHFNYSPHTYHMLYIKTICQTICVYEALMPFPHGQVLQLSWSPKAELILRLLQSSKPWGFPIDMCTHFSSLPLHCLSRPMLIWIFILLSEMLSGNLIYRVSFSKLVKGSFSTSPFLLFWFQGVAPALQLSAFSSQKLSVSQIPFLSYDIKGI